MKHIKLLSLVRPLLTSVAVVSLLLPTLPQALAQAERDCEDTAAAGKIVRRRLPGKKVRCKPKSEAPQAPKSGAVSKAAVQERKFRIPRPTLQDYPPSVPLPDRWRIVDSIGYTNNWWDPYNRNTLKGDLPVWGEWFYSQTIIVDSVYERREVQLPVGIQTTERAGQLDLYGADNQSAFIQTVLMEFVWLRGDTVFRPPDWEFRLTPAINFNYTRLEEANVVNVDPADGTTRYENFVGLQAAFVDYHIRNVSDRFDFDSVRFGIQPFNNDFRGFLFQDNQFGLRVFGTRDNNIYQYNLAWFRRMEKDINSGLNDPNEALRKDDVFIANLFWQDMLALGHISQFSIVHNRNREDEFFFDDNGFIQRPFSFGFERPREYDVTYLGFSGDGHFGRVNLSHSYYYLFGDQENGPYVNEKTDIKAHFFGAEMSIDTDWVRWRLSFVDASGDDDPFDDEETGFDAIFENPQIAGSDASYWIRQGVPLIGGGGVALSQRNGILSSLRSSKEHGQSNFTNPGVRLIGLGADLDVLPELRLTANYNELEWKETEVLETARQQAGISKDIGTDISVSAIYRPLMSQNIVLRASYGLLKPGSGFKDLFGDEDQKSILLNATFVY